MMTLITSSTDSFIRQCGYSLMVAGITIALFWLTTIPFESFAGKEVALHPLFIPGQILHSLGAALTSLGFVGLYLYISVNTGKMALVGFLLAFFGALGFVADGMIALVIFPVLANLNPELIEVTGAMFTGYVLGYFISFAVIQMIGNIIFGIAAWRSHRVPNIACALLIVGGVVSNLPPIPSMHLLMVFGGVTWGVGAVWLGKEISKR